MQKVALFKAVKLTILRWIFHVFLIKHRLWRSMFELLFWSSMKITWILMCSRYADDDTILNYFKAVLRLLTIQPASTGDRQCGVKSNGNYRWGYTI